jgi:hypothetical protein
VEFDCLEEVAGGGDDPVGGVADRFGVAARPVRDVAKAVAGGGQPGRLTEDVGDAFGFDLGLAATAGGVFGAGVHGGVGQSWARVLAAWAGAR